MPIRRTTAAAVLAGTLALTACGSPQSGPAAPAAPAGPIEISVSLFGTFGYDGGRPLQAVRGRRTPAPRSSTSRRRARTSTGPRCRPGSRRGSGLADIQGIEVGRIADVVTNQADKWTDLNQTPAPDAVGTLHRLEGAGGHHAPTARCSGLGTDIGPMAHLLPQRPAREGRPAHRPAPRSPRSARPGTATSPSARSTRPRPRPAPPGPTRRAGSTTRSSPASSRSTTTRPATLVYATNPAVKQALDTAAKAAATGLTAKLEQFVDPGWDQGFGSGRVRHHRLPVLDDRLHQGQGRRRRRGQVERRRRCPAARRQLGRLVPRASPAASPHKEQAAKLITWLTAPEQQAKVFTKVGNFPSTTGGDRPGRRRRPTRTSPTRRSARSSPSGAGRAGADPRPARTASIKNAITARPCSPVEQNGATAPDEALGADAATEIDDRGSAE